MTTLQEENEVLNQLKDAAMKETTEANSELEAERATLNDTNQELEAETAKLNVAKQELESTKIDLKKKSTKNSTLSNELTRRDQLIAELKKEKEALTKENISLKNFFRLMDKAIRDPAVQLLLGAAKDPGQPLVESEQQTVEPDQPIVESEQQKPTVEPNKACAGFNQDNQEPLKQKELTNEQHLAALDMHAVDKEQKQSTKRGSDDEIMERNTKRNRTV